MKEMNLFKLLEIKEDTKSNKMGFSLGINLKISEFEIEFPIIPICYNENELIREVGLVYKNLDKIVGEAKKGLKRISSGGKISITPEMKPDDIWSALEKFQAEEIFVEQFNGLEEDIRKAVAEYVLTKCNVFSGKGAIFSKRYNERTKYIE